MKIFKSILLLTILWSAMHSCKNTGTAITQSTGTGNETSKNETPAVVQNLNQQEFMNKKNSSGVVVIDVRTPSEVAQGYITGTSLFLDYNGGEFSSKIPSLDKNTTYLLYCRSGGRSGNAAQEMINMGFKNVSHLVGGISNWTGSVETK